MDFVKIKKGKAQYQMILRKQATEYVICCAFCGKELEMAQIQNPITCNETGNLYCSDDCIKEDLKSLSTLPSAKETNSG